MGDEGQLLWWSEWPQLINCSINQPRNTAESSSPLRQNDLVPATLRSLYRSILREFPPRPLLASPRSSLHTRLRDTFTAAETSDARAQAAAQAVAYLRSQRQYATLLERYNPGMGMDEEERVRLTARRVGMDLPVEYK
ncbi:hypothetical protein B0T10DRAFT_571341 [Thelonectria olida]|uniref:Uncharacterized protein n=1 Tax=Thelonectria olida TaxID=1576542 RepID=A0A9P8WJN6_9HYPO|nr:hypothetical protein B0T10DRAFT_571341 [Thelonectria olida]